MYCLSYNNINTFICNINIKMQCLRTIQLCTVTHLDILHPGAKKNLAPLRGLTTGNMGDLNSFFLKKQHIS